jgi:hypothetical protein
MYPLKKYSLFQLFFYLLLICNTSKGQPDKAEVDSTQVPTPALENIIYTSIFHLPVFSRREYIIRRNPAEGDTALIRSNEHLLLKGPDYKTYEAYADLAAAYWRAGRNDIAKKMYRLIEQSGELFYTGTLFHSTGNTYEYGSYTSNFKNGACLYLCRIFIEERKYTKALHYLIQADKKHKIQYNCGTGALWHTNELNNLYVICYSGLGFTDKVIDLYLKESFYNDDAFIALIKKNYSLPELKRQLQLALDNIAIIKDSWPTEYFMESKSGNADSLISRFTGGTGHTILFGRKITLPKPELKHGEVISRQHFIDGLKQSLFYCRLLGLNKKEESPVENSSSD